MLCFYDSVFFRGPRSTVHSDLGRATQATQTSGGPISLRCSLHLRFDDGWVQMVVPTFPALLSYTNPTLLLFRWLGPFMSSLACSLFGRTQMTANLTHRPFQWENLQSETTASAHTSLPAPWPFHPPMTTTDYHHTSIQAYKHTGNQPLHSSATWSSFTQAHRQCAVENSRTSFVHGPLMIIWFVLGQEIISRFLFEFPFVILYVQWC